MSSWVASRYDLTRFGVTAAALVPEARTAQVVDVPSCTFALPGHGFGGGEQLELAPAAGGVLPAGTSAIASYLTKLLPSQSSRLFTITNLDGSPVTITDAGSGVLTVLVDMGPTVDAIMAAETSLVVARAKAYRGPWTTPPAWAPAMVADLAGPRIAKLLRVSSPQYSITDLMTFREQALRQLDSMAKGEPMNDGVGPIDAGTPPGTQGAPQATGRPPMFCRTRTL
ncbi:MAG TPA: hypothetical protein VLT47_10870 [Anaeromyxobacteraceae bacterium]|nr:hypothetical protein [Anaeromyxobacteraceae bacterium]